MKHSLLIFCALISCATYPMLDVINHASTFASSIIEQYPLLPFSAVCGITQATLDTAKKKYPEQYNKWGAFVIKTITQTIGNPEASMLNNVPLGLKKVLDEFTKPKNKPLRDENPGNYIKKIFEVFYEENKNENGVVVTGKTLSEGTKIAFFWPRSTIKYVGHKVHTVIAKNFAENKEESIRNDIGNYLYLTILYISIALAQTKWFDYMSHSEMAHKLIKVFTTNKVAQEKNSVQKEDTSLQQIIITNEQ